MDDTKDTAANPQHVGENQLGKIYRFGTRLVRSEVPALWSVASYGSGVRESATGIACDWQIKTNPEQTRRKVYGLQPHIKGAPIGIQTGMGRGVQGKCSESPGSGGEDTENGWS